MLLMSGLLRPLYKGWRGGTGRPAGGPLNVHTNVPLTARQSPERKPPISRNTLLILLHSLNIRSMLSLGPLTLLVLSFEDNSLFSLLMLAVKVAYYQHARP